MDGRNSVGIVIKARDGNVGVIVNDIDEPATTITERKEEHPTKRVRNGGILPALPPFLGFGISAGRRGFFNGNGNGNFNGNGNANAKNTELLSNGVRNGNGGDGALNGNFNGNFNNNANGFRWPWMHGDWLHDWNKFWHNRGIHFGPNGDRGPPLFRGFNAFRGQRMVT